MSIEDRRRWDDRHAGRPVIEPRPPAALDGRSEIGNARRGTRALDIACGAGSVAVWLALRGYEVVGLDVSSVALERARVLADRHGVGDLVDLAETDFDSGLPTGLGTFGIVVCQRFRDPGLYQPIADAVAPGGLLVMTILSTVGYRGEPGPFRAAPGELPAAFADGFDVLIDVEADGEAHLVARARD